MQRKIKEKKDQKEDRLKLEQEAVKSSLNNIAKSFASAQEKGTSSWLSALPIKALGYVLNKQEFRDAISLRYGWDISGTPKFCACGQRNSVDHTLICKKGGMWQ